MPAIREALATLVERLSADGDLDDDDLEQIHDAAIAQAQAIQQDRKWAATAHIHKVKHEDAGKLVCHDCGRGLIADVTDKRVLVCPTLHGRRPLELDPDTDSNYAVECGRK